MKERKPFQGVWNIIRFNWHFYALTLLLVIMAWSISNTLPPIFQYVLVVGIFLAILLTLDSLFASFYVYDLSELYELEWLEAQNDKKILNINAGFDETSTIILDKFPTCTLTICDFYDLTKHTEISIKRARAAYPPMPNTLNVSTAHLPFEDAVFDSVMVFMAAHEIRDADERTAFFKEIRRVTALEGQIYVTEHLRDGYNFLAYTIGFFHFYSKKDWLQIFGKARLSVRQEIKTTPFVSTFILEQHGTAN